MGNCSAVRGMLSFLKKLFASIVLKVEAALSNTCRSLITKQTSSPCVRF